MNEHKNIEESPLRPEKKVKQKENNPVISSFQKHEALVLTDNSDHYAEWPTTHSNKLSGYKHKPIINKVVMKDKKDIDIIQKVMDSIRQCSLAKSNKLDLKAVFKQFDTSGDGSISKDEMRAALLSLNVNLDEEAIHSVYRYFDPNGSGEVDFGEFIWTFYNRKRLNNTPTSSNTTNSKFPKPLDMQKSLSKIKLKSKVVDKFSDNSKQSTRDILEPLAEQKDNISDTITEIPEIKNIYTEEDKLLYLAEQLLSNVTSCITPKSKAIIPNEIDKLLENPISILSFQQQYPTSSSTMSENNSHMTQIEWLLRGLPEAYDSEPQFDDETVEAILKEGGSPPTQLVLPSVYAVNQKVLNKLNTSKILRIKFNHLLVFSARFGLRKEGSYLVIHPPIGCIRPASEPNTLMLPLSELQDADHQIAQLLRKNTKRDSIRNYFVGNVELDKKIIELKLNITDEIMREWINNTMLGTIKIEIFGYLAPRDTMIRGKFSEPACIASTKIPLGGLLGTPSLDAILHCDLEVDITSHSSILSRMSNISFGQTIVTKTKPLGNKIGTLTTRITLLSEEYKDNNKQPLHKDKSKADMVIKRVLPGDEETSSLLIPVMNNNDLITKKYYNDSDIDTHNDDDINNMKQNHDHSDKIHNALAYIPSEVSKNTMSYNKYNSIDLSKFEMDINRSTYGPNISELNCNFGIALCGITNLQLPIETIVDINKSKLDLNLDPEIIISYKLSSSSSDKTQTRLSNLKTNNPCLLISQTKLYQTDIHHWIAPILEIWLTWKQKCYLNENNHYIEDKKQLLGLSKFPKEYNIKQLLTLPIIDTLKSTSSNFSSNSNNSRGELIVSIHLESDIIRIENYLYATINKYQIDMNKLYDLNIQESIQENSNINNMIGNRNGDVSINTGDLLVANQEKIIKINNTNHHDTFNSDANNNNDIKTDNKDIVVNNNTIQEISNHNNNNTNINISEDSIENLCILLNDYNMDNNQNIQHDRNVDKVSISISNEFNESNYYEEILNNSTEKSILRYDSNNNNTNEISSEINTTNNIELPPLKSSFIQEPHIAADVYNINESIHDNNSYDVIDNNDIMYEATQSIFSEEQVHLLDFSIQGSFNYISLKSEALATPHQIFGCYVCYHLKDSISTSINPNILRSSTSTALDVSINNQSIWWDGDCPVLNGSIRHRFEGNLSSIDSLYEILEIDIIKKGLTFQLLSCDTDGNLSNDSIILGESFLSITTLYNVLKQLGCNEVISIPIQFMNIDPTIFLLNLNNNESIPMLNLIISHRIEPVLLRKSMESLHCQSNEIEKHVTTIGDSSNNVHTSLGFELTLQDLDNIHKLRNTFQNPIWIPFDDNQVTKDTASSNYDINKKLQEDKNNIKSIDSIDITTSQSNDSKSSIDLEIVLEEYAHLNIDMSKLTKPFIICTATAKVHPSYEITHSIMDSNTYISSSDAHLNNPSKKNYSDNLIIPWKEPYLINLKGFLPPPLLSSSSEVIDDQDEYSENQQDKTVEDMNLLYIGGNSDYKDTSKILKGASIVVSIYLRQQLFTHTIYTSNNDIMNDNKRSIDNDEDDNNIKITDQLLGSAVIDISTLALGMPIIQGWYHLIDELHNCIGQIKLSIKRFSNQHDQSYSLIQQPEFYINEDKDNKIITLSNEDIIEATMEQEVLCDNSLLDLRGLAHDALKRSLEELQVINDRLLGNIVYNQSIESITSFTIDIQPIISEGIVNYESNTILNESKSIDSYSIVDNQVTIAMLPNNNRSDIFWNIEEESYERSIDPTSVIEVSLKQQQQIDYNYTKDVISHYQNEMQSYKEDNKTLYHHTYDTESYESIEDHSHVISDNSSSYQCKEYETDEYMPDFESISTTTNEFYASRSGILITNELSHINNEEDESMKDQYTIVNIKETYQATDINDFNLYTDDDDDDDDDDDNDEKVYDNDDDVEYIDEFEEPSESSSYSDEGIAGASSSSTLIASSQLVLPSLASVVHITKSSIDNSENQSIAIYNTESDKSTSKSVSIRGIEDNKNISVDIIESSKSISLDDNVSSKSISILDIESNKSVNKSISCNNIRSTSGVTIITKSVNKNISINDNESNRSLSNHDTKSLSDHTTIHDIDLSNNASYTNVNQTIISTFSSDKSKNIIEMITQKEEDIQILTPNVSISTSSSSNSSSSSSIDSSNSNHIDILESSLVRDIHQNMISITPIHINNTSITNISNDNNQLNNIQNTENMIINNKILPNKDKVIVKKDEDSPNTIKIKGVIDKEIERIFGIDVTQSNETIETLSNQSIFKLYTQSKDREDKYSNLTKQYEDINDIHQWYKSETETLNKQPYINPIEPLSKHPNQSYSKDNNVLYKNIIDIQNLLPSSELINNKAKKNVLKYYPIGKQRKFIDEETNRISNIMMNVIHKKHL